jgi:hypothetical protein
MSPELVISVVFGLVCGMVFLIVIHFERPVRRRRPLVDYTDYDNLQNIRQNPARRQKNG